MGEMDCADIQTIPILRENVQSLGGKEHFVAMSGFFLERHI